jgi:hypothetical protein
MAKLNKDTLLWLFVIIMIIILLAVCIPKILNSLGRWL